MTIEHLKSFAIKLMEAPPGYKSRNQEINIKLLSNHISSIQDLKQAVLLDCGCGMGENIIKIKKKLPEIGKIIGIDNYEPSVEICNAKYSKDAEFILGDCLDMPIDSKSVQVIISNQVIEHISQYEKYINEMRRVLFPGGLLVISTPNAHCPKNVFIKLIGKQPILRWSNQQNLPPAEYRGHTQEFSEKELIDLMIEAGFSLLEIHPIQPKYYWDGNIWFNLYSLVEYIFYKMSKPFVAPGYSKNSNMIFQLVDNQS